jgi:hypothetical protein
MDDRIKSGHNVVVIGSPPPRGDEGVSAEPFHYRVPAKAGTMRSAALIASTLVMPGLDPGIHTDAPMDRRIKSGHVGKGGEGGGYADFFASLYTAKVWLIYQPNHSR